MKNYKIIISYNGERYKGFQKQGNTYDTIQEKIENILEKMKGEPIKIYGSGRTDAGAHASYQVANFKIDTDMSKKEILKYINKYLPNDIAIMSIEQVDKSFHSRLNAKNKTYLYRINNTGIPNVFNKSFVYHIDEKLDIEKMRRASTSFLGEHNFLPFSSLKKEKKSTVRKIYNISIYEENEEIKIYIKGSGFLYNMVRIMVGTLIEIGLDKRKNNIEKILKSGDRQDAGITAPSCGLCLVDVEY